MLLTSLASLASLVRLALVAPIARLVPPTPLVVAMAAYRRRRMGRGSRRRAGRVGRLRTAVVNAVFECENVEYAINTPGTTTWGNWTSTSGAQLKAWQSLSGGPNAVLYAFRFNPAFLIGQCSGAASLTGIYDYFKIRYVDLQLRCDVNPRAELTYTQTASSPLGAGAQLNFLATPNYDPDITFIDYDGIDLAQGSPANGDITSQALNRLRARRHRAFASMIRRRFVPRILNLVAVTQPPGAPGTNPVTASGVAQLGKRCGWLNGAVNNCFTGQIGLAVSYKGSDTSSQNAQPMYNWAVTAKWACAVKSSLLG